MRVLAQVCAAEVLDFARGRHQIDVRLVISPRASRPQVWVALSALLRCARAAR